jgi:predicted DNA-binding protein YlxM (UPF0122 family)
MYDKEVNMSPKLTEVQIEESIKMYQAGLSLAPIAEYYNVSRQALWSHLKDKIELRPQHTVKKTSNLLEIAMQKGIVVKKANCEMCGISERYIEIQPHQNDHDKPLDVVWLCRRCHRDQIAFLLKGPKEKK